MLSFITQEQLLQTALSLPPLKLKSREVISSGAQSIVISNGYQNVLLITRYKVAKNIELLRDKMQPIKTELIDVPELAGANQNVISLLTGVPNPSKKLFQATKKLNGLLPDLLTKNFVYNLPRYDGNLDHLKTLRYKDDSIELLEKMLKESLAILHGVNLTHNDICLRNILYSGTYPQLKFRLCDFGSLTQSDPISEARKYQFDLQKIERVITSARMTLAIKYDFKSAAQSNSVISSNHARKAQILGISPLKANAPQKRSETGVKSQIVSSLLDKFSETLEVDSSLSKSIEYLPSKDKKSKKVTFVKEEDERAKENMFKKHVTR